MQFYGIIPPTLTPFNANGSIDEVAFRALISFHIEKGVHGIYPIGSAGEGLLLATEERRQLSRIAVDEAAGRVPVMVHTGAISTKESVELTIRAADQGADAVSCLPPFYYDYDDEAIFAHVKAVADAVPGSPVYVYNNPATTGNHVSTAIMVRLVAECPNIAGIKDSSGSLAQTQDYLHICGRRLTVLTGSNVITVASLVMGCCGVISSMANVFPETAVAMWHAYLEGDLKRSAYHQDLLIRARKAMLSNGGLVAGLKAMLQERGLRVGSTRKPIRQLSQDEKKSVERACRDLGLLTSIV